MIRRPPRSTLDRSSAASDVYKRQCRGPSPGPGGRHGRAAGTSAAVSYTHLRAHETPEHLVCRLLLEKKKIEAALDDHAGDRRAQREPLPDGVGLSVELQ